MRTIETKTIPNIRERVDRKKIDDDYSTRYFKREFREW